MTTFEDYDESELEGAISLNKAERVGLKSRLHDLQEICRARKRNIFGTIFKAFELMEELLLCRNSADNPGEKNAQVGRCCALEEELLEMRKGVEESSTRKKKSDKPRQEADGIKNDALITLREKGTFGRGERT